MSAGTSWERFMADLGRREPERQEYRERLLVQLIVRLLLGVVYFGLLFALGAPPWAFVLALISATYWGPPR